MITIIDQSGFVTTLANPGPQGPTGAQGPQGLQGPPGTGTGDPTQFFQVANKFSELDTVQKKIDARTNLELQYIDCGTFN